MVLKALTGLLHTYIKDRPTPTPTPPHSTPTPTPPTTLSLFPLASLLDDSDFNYGGGEGGGEGGGGSFITTDLVMLEGVPTKVMLAIVLVAGV
jgi:hypothetical protein